MKKVYNIILIVIAIAIISVIVLIAIKYGKNYANEKEVGELIEQIKQGEQNIEIEEINMEYKGYKVVGIIKIPKIDLEYPILSVTNNETMKISITKFWGDGVNEIGNLSLAGHNNYDSTMFGRNKNLEIGDSIELTDMKMVTKKYMIYNKYITEPNDSSVTETDEFGTREVTLITCSNGNKERLILKAREI